MCGEFSIIELEIPSEGFVMIRICKNTIKKQTNFWNNATFHPTDAVEDPWGKRILDKMAEERTAKTIRIYAMLEDIVYYDGDGVLKYDFRLSDLRLDYLHGLGYELLLTYGGMPDCIAKTTNQKSSMSNGKTRYKGKMWNTSMPRDIRIWEDICYEYTKHIIERYGLDVVSKWSLSCFNEPDASSFLLKELSSYEQPIERCVEYCKLYDAFVRGTTRASEGIRIGGPVVAGVPLFFEAFLKHVKETRVRLDFLSIHNYGTHPSILERNERKITVDATIEKHEKYLKIIKEQGFEDKEILMDEWGVCTSGFRNMSEFPVLEFRETEVFPAYYVKTISEFIKRDYRISKMFICLSGQHEMQTDFTGFRGFFTLNFIKKPIYNVYVMASRLHEGLLSFECENNNLHIIPTKDENGNYAVLLSYSGEFFEEDIETLNENLSFEEELVGKTVTVYRIDKETTNPYRVYQRLGLTDLSTDDIMMLRREGEMKPVYTGTLNGDLELTLTPNSTYLISVC